MGYQVKLEEETNSLLSLKTCLDQRCGRPSDFPWQRFSNTIPMYNYETKELVEAGYKDRLVYLM